MVTGQTRGERPSEQLGIRELISLRDVTVRKCKSVRGGFKTLMNASSQWAGREAAGKRWKTTPKLIASRVKPFP